MELRTGSLDDFLRPTFEVLRKKELPVDALAALIKFVMLLKSPSLAQPLMADYPRWDKEESDPSLNAVIMCCTGSLLAFLQPQGRLG